MSTCSRAARCCSGRNETRWEWLISHSNVRGKHRAQRTPTQNRRLTQKHASGKQPRMSLQQRSFFNHAKQSLSCLSCSCVAHSPLTSATALASAAALLLPAVSSCCLCWRSFYQHREVCELCTGTPGLASSSAQHTTAAATAAAAQEQHSATSLTAAWAQIIALASSNTSEQSGRRSASARRASAQGRSATAFLCVASAGVHGA